MHDKMKNWSEGHGSYADMTDGVGLFSDDESVSATIVKRGVIPMANCNNCGRQWKGLVMWPEIALYYLQSATGVVRPPLDEKATQFVRQGVMCKLRCNGCPNGFTMVIPWAELEQWVNAGVSSGALKPEIKTARRR